MYWTRNSTHPTQTVVWSDKENKEKIGSIRHTQPLLGESPFYIVDLVPRTSPDIRPATQTWYVPLLQSAIQKTMRRGLIEPCLSITRQLLRQDPTTCLRRLPIILLEDSMIHAESFCTLVWLMCAHSKGYVLTQDDEQFVMDCTMTSLLATMRYDRSIVPLEPLTDVSDVQKAILVRVLYGGMKGDCQWMTHMAHRTSPVLRFLPEIQRAPVTQECDDFLFNSEHIIPQAIDFHCYPQLLSYLKTETGLSIPMLKQLIWTYWSSINVRECESGDKSNRTQNRTYTNIEPLLYKYAAHVMKEEKVKAKEAKEKEQHKETPIQPKSTIKQTTLSFWIKKK